MDEHKPRNRKRESIESITHETGMIYPHAIEFEVAVLGAMLLEEQGLTTALALLKSDTFYKESHKLILKAITNLATTTGIVDILTVTHELSRMKELQNVGGALYISQLTNRISSTAHVEEHCRILEEKAMARRLINTCQDTIREAFLENVDVFDLCDTHNENFINIGHADPVKLTMSIYDRTSRALNSVVELQQKGSSPGIRIGLEAFDSISNGLQVGFYVFAARPGNGKTEFSIFLSHEVAKQGYGVYVAQCEMSEEQASFRDIAKTTGLYYSDITKAKFTNDDLMKMAAAVDGMKNLPLYLDIVPGITLSKLESKIKYQVKKNKIKVAVLDYIQLIDDEIKRGQTRDQAIGRITRRFKKLANELKITIFALAQLGRGTTERKFGIPELQDLRESGNIENDADAVILAYYPGEYKHLYLHNGGSFEDSDGKSLDGLVAFIVAKNRLGIPNTKKYARWDRGTVQYSNDTSNAIIEPYKWKKAEHADSKTEGGARSQAIQPNTSFDNAEPF